MKFKKTFIIFLITFILLNLTIIFATANNNKKISNFFRIHIVANSDSIDDQILKYNVAKQIEQYIYELTKNCANKQESKKTIEQNMQNILTLCNHIIQNNGYDYDLTAYIGKIQYDEKQKDGVTMSEGIYDSLKIVIGNGTGDNWWSLIYPTFVDSDNKKIAPTSNDIECKFFIVEWFKELFD